MPLSAEEHKRLADKAKHIRERIVEVTERSGGGHLGGSLSQTDFLVAIYYKYAKVDPKNPRWEDRDRIVLSKGHGGLGHATILGDLGFFPDPELDKFNKTGSKFGMHLDRMKVPGVDASTGSLAHGFAIGLGMAMGAKLAGKDWHTYIVLSDGECQEGTIWEGVMAGAMFKLTNCTCIVDRNRMSLDGPTEEIMALDPLDKKFEAFGWRTIVIDGHDLNQVCDALEAARAETEKPVMIVANTVKGKGVDFMEDQPKWHYGGLDSEMAARALASLRGK
ncbi:MAG: transketolase [Deltaproteobacteria bacterium]|nr:transketolase [Deltaproteobacteria bacterium]